MRKQWFEISKDDADQLVCVLLNIAEGGYPKAKDCKKIAKITLESIGVEVN